MATHDADGVKVKRDGPRGFHIIDKARFDPKVHELYEEPKAKKPSDGLNVEQLKEALTAKGITIPDGAKKPELAALLDAAE